MAIEPHAGRACHRDSFRTLRPVAKSETMSGPFSTTTPMWMRKLAFALPVMITFPKNMKVSTPCLRLSCLCWHADSWHTSTSSFFCSCGRRCLREAASAPWPHCASGKKRSSSSPAAASSSTCGGSRAPSSPARMFSQGRHGGAHKFMASMCSANGSVSWHLGQRSQIPQLSPCRPFQEAQPLSPLSGHAPPP